MFYESPNRLIKSLDTIKDVLGPKHPVFVGLELTKQYEKHLHGSVSDVQKDLMH